MKVEYWRPPNARMISERGSLLGCNALWVASEHSVFKRKPAPGAIRGGSGSREENASKQNIAFSSEVEPGSREENAPKQNVAFSSEVEPGSREENASKQKELSSF